MKSYAALWVGMSLSIPAYMLASSLLAGGLSWWQALLAVFLGNSLILIPMLLNSHAGTQYGIPFPIYVRASFGIRGAHIPAIIRALIACGWFGIQAWIGSEAVYELLKTLNPGVATLPDILPQWVGLNSGQAISVVFFWSLNALVILKGIELMRRLLLIQTLLLFVVTFVTIFWAISVPNSLDYLISHGSSKLPRGELWAFFFASLSAIVGYFSTISLNITDFTRYAITQRAQIVGQSLALPTSMTLITFIGVFVTTSSYAMIGKLVWDPVILAGYIPYISLKILLMLSIIFITLVANLALNVVSPANDFSHLWPRHISFKRGGILTVIIALLIMPWKLIKDPNGYIFIWLTGVSSLLGSILGIMLADYYILRKTHLNVDGLYAKNALYWYCKGINPIAVFAFLLGIIPNLPGFFSQVGLWSNTKLPKLFLVTYDYAWFISLIISIFVYLLLMRRNYNE